MPTRLTNGASCNPRRLVARAPCPVDDAGNTDPDDGAASPRINSSTVAGDRAQDWIALPISWASYARAWHCLEPAAHGGDDTPLRPSVTPR